MLPSPDHVLTIPPTVKAADTSTKPTEAVEAALLAVALYHGRLNAAQACKLAGASTLYFSKVNSLGAHEREQLQTGELTLADFNGRRTNGHANGKSGRSSESLLEHLQRSTAAELAVAGNVYGVAKIFDTMIVPSIDDDGEIIPARTAK
jgi:hypothetical protein